MEFPQKIYDNLGGRKAVFLLVLIIISILTTLFISEKYYSTMMQYLSIMYGSFCIGNSVSNIRKQ